MTDRLILTICRLVVAGISSICLLYVVCTATARAEEIGEVNTTFKVLGANDKIVIEAFDDPDIPGATCYVSRAKTGGISGSLGVAEDTSDASISCRQTSAIVLPERVISGRDNGKQVFKKSTSILFKKMQVVRFYDKKRHTLVYLGYSDKLIDGSPKNSISTIALAVPAVVQAPDSSAVVP
ncbi:MAG: protein CreA [Desulfobulbaceae bacterium]|nr:protein CreA [Desulfobulbaceae bacterium]